MTDLSRPLDRVTVVELRGLGPAPLAGMMLADMGATVIRVDRPGAPPRGTDDRINPVHRGKRSIAIDLKSSAGVEALLRIIDQADVLIEGNRPGVMERLGLGPDVCLARRPRLVYGRMTGWGQDGPLALAAGHDINYIGLAGVLDGMGSDPEAAPVPAVSYVGDFGGGTMFLLYGILCALRVAEHTGRGQVVDAAMVDGAAALSAAYHGLRADGKWHLGRGRNVIDGGAPYYGVYECSDGRYITIASAEPQFYALLRAKLGLDEELWNAQTDESKWPEQQQCLARVFLSKSRDEWCELLESTDVCFAPVLDMDEAPRHRHNMARGTFIDIDGVTQPAPAPRLSATPGAVVGDPPLPGTDTISVLEEAGYDRAHIADLIATGAVSAREPRETR